MLTYKNVYTLIRNTICESLVNMKYFKHKNSRQLCMKMVLLHKAERHKTESSEVRQNYWPKIKWQNKAEILQKLLQIMDKKT